MEARDQSHSKPTPESAILAELMAAAPIAAADLKDRVCSKVAGLKATQYKSVLDGLVAARKIHGRPKLGSKGKPTRTIASYALGAPPPPPPAPRDVAPGVILEALRTGSIAPAKLSTQSKALVPGLTPKDFKAVMDELVASGKVYARRKRGKNGKPTTTVDLYVLGGPEPDEFVLPVLVVWHEKLTEALAAGLKEEQLIETLLAALKVERRTEVLRSNDVTDDREAVLRSARRLVSREGAGALIPLRKLRAELDLPKQRFDAAVLLLYAQDAIILHHHDYVGSLSATERDALVIDEHGNHYVGLALRGGT
jgi:hypothetical protein